MAPLTQRFPDLATWLRVLVWADDPLARAGLVTLVAEALDAAGGTIVNPDDMDQADAVLWALPARPLTNADLAPLDNTDLPVLALLADQEQLDPVLSAGAQGAVLRQQLTADSVEATHSDLDDPARALVAALVALRHGLWVVDPQLGQTLVQTRRFQSVAEPEASGPAMTGGGSELTQRELDVLELLAEGLSNRRIATALGISEHTAKFHTSSILAKLGVRTRTEAALEAVRRGLLFL